MRMTKLGVLGRTAIFLCLPGTGCLGADKIYVANEDDGTVSVISAGVVVKTIDTAVGSGHTGKLFMTHNVQAAPDGKSVWVTANAKSGHGHEGPPEEGDSDELVILDPKTDRIVRRLPLGAGLHLAHVILDANSKFAYVTASETGEVFKIDAKAFRVVNKIQLGKDAGPHGGRICGKFFFVAKMSGKGIMRIDLESGELITVPLGGMAVQAACTSKGRGEIGFVSLYDSREVARINFDTRAVERAVLPEGSQGPAQILLSRSERILFIADQGMLLGRPSSDKLYLYDPETLNLLSTILVGGGAHGIAEGTDGSKVYVANAAENSVSVVDVGAQKTVRSISVGKKPNGISVLRQ